MPQTTSPSPTSHTGGRPDVPLHGRTAPVQAAPVRRIYAQLGRLLGGKAVAGLIGIPNLVIATHALGATGFGVLVLVSGFTALVGGIAEFPCWQAVLRYGAEAARAGDDQRLLRLLRATILIEIAGGVVAVVSAGLLGRLLGPRLGWTPAAVALALPFGLSALASIRSVPAAYLQLRDRYDLLAFHSLLQPGVRLAGCLVVLRVGASLPGFMLTWLAAALVEFAALWLLAGIVANSHLGLRRLFGSPRGVFAENPRLLPFMLGANADVTFGELADRLVPVVLGWSAGPQLTGLFRVAQRAAVLLSQPAAMLGRTAYAEFAALAAARDAVRLRSALLHSVGLALAAAAPVLVLLGVLRRPLVRLLGGASFHGAEAPMLWLLGAQALLLAAPPISAALVALGRPGTSVAVNAVARLSTLPLLPLAIGAFGLIGSGVQAMVAAIATDLLLIAAVRAALARGFTEG